MNARWKLSGLATAIGALLVGVILGLSVGQVPWATAQQPDSTSSRYTVCHTEGTNLIVTDNKANTLYFYTTDPGSEAGSDLKLRGSVDLSQVGKQVMVPKLFKK
jgi:hypothetical protein